MMYYNKEQKKKHKEFWAKENKIQARKREEERIEKAIIKQVQEKQKARMELYRKAKGGE